MGETMEDTRASPSDRSDQLQAVAATHTRTRVAVTST